MQYFKDIEPIIANPTYRIFSLSFSLIP